MSRYNLPPCPDNVSARAVISQLISGVISRYANATEDLPEHISTFKVCDSAMSIIKVYKHIYQLSYWTTSAWDKSISYAQDLSSLDDYRTATLQTLIDLRNLVDVMSEEQLSSATLYHKRTDSYLPFWYIINGPLSDILTHIGQINSWRRAAGFPCSSFSPLLGIVTK